MHPKLPQIKPEALQPGECLCDHCTAKCCRYYALQIDTPECRADMDYLRWYMIHGQTSIFTEEGEWYLLVHTTCRHLQADHRCGIYMTRPQICREYSTDNCEYDNNYVYERYFETPEQLDEFTDAMWPAEEQAVRTPRPALLPVIG
ncbi:MAG: YkgJ family cysteine cluster protein [Planctomycetes bacterium]|nr:YkgJ family cysteine cluster protein [Planctomycetota bacterium]